MKSVALVVLAWLSLVGVGQCFSPPRILGVISPPGDYTDESECGRAPSGWRIVGGQPTVHGNYPWQVSLQTIRSTGRINHFCGATIINRHWLLTAAHCFDERTRVDDILAVAGDTKLNVYEGTEKRFGIKAAFVHRGYDAAANTPRHDIALLRLHRPLEYTSHIQPICLNRLIRRFEESSWCFMTGWGDTKGTGDWVHLRELHAQVMDQDNCNALWYGGIRPGNVCVGLGEKGVCDGDSGGPFQCMDADGRFYQVGVTSYGTVSCQDYGFPAVFTRVSMYTSWIRHIMAKY